MHQSVILIIIDSLRYDVIADVGIRRKIAPTLDAIIEDGSLGKIVANASNTQFVMPTLLTGSYPLDYGGYNTGVNFRPPGFVEKFQEQGFSTHLYSNCVLYNRNLGFSRGFDTVLAPVNTRRSLTQDIEYRILPYLQEWKQRGQPESDAISFLQGEYCDILQNFIMACDSAQRIPSEFPVLRKRDLDLARKARRELDLVHEVPQLVTKKLLSVPEAFYWTVLGDRRPGPTLFFNRILNKVWQKYSKIGFPQKYASGLWDAFDVMTQEVEPALDRLFHASLSSKKKKSFTLLHIMDVHTPQILVNQVRRCPDIVQQKELHYNMPLEAESGNLKRYFGAVKSTDQILDNIIKKIKEHGDWNNTALFITSDHGTTLPERDGMPVPDLPNRFEHQDLEVPIIAAGGLCRAVRLGHGLHDSRDLGATLLQVGLSNATTFEAGVAMTDGMGRDGIVSENGGRGRLDLDHNDLNFRVTGHGASILVRLTQSDLQIVNRWESGNAPPESDEELLAILFRERGKILEDRGVLHH